MELRLLEIFSRVVELGSFSKAAKSLDLTQPTVSIHVKTLEKEVSSKLLDRLGRTVRLTQAGTILYKYAKDVMKLKDDACMALSQYASNIKGELFIGASTMPGEYVLPELMAKFHEAYPEVVARLTVASTDAIYEKVIDCSVDVAILGAYLEDASIISTPYSDDEIVLIAPNDFPEDEVSVDSINDIPLILRDSASGTRKTYEAALKRAGLNPDKGKVVAYMGSIQSVIMGVRSGLGLAFISGYAATESVEAGRVKLIKVDGLELKRRFYLVTNKLRYNSPITKTFMEFLEKTPLK